MKKVSDFDFVKADEFLLEYDGRNAFKKVILNYPSGEKIWTTFLMKAATNISQNEIGKQLGYSKSAVSSYLFTFIKEFNLARNTIIVSVDQNYKAIDDGIPFFEKKQNNKTQESKIQSQQIINNYINWREEEGFFKKIINKIKKWMNL